MYICAGCNMRFWSDESPPHTEKVKVWSSTDTAPREAPKDAPIQIVAFCPSCAGVRRGE